MIKLILVGSKVRLFMILFQVLVLFCVCIFLGFGLVVLVAFLLLLIV